MKRFTNESTRLVFSQPNRVFDDFNKLMFNTGLGVFEGGITKEQANDKIREVMFEVLGVDSSVSKKELRKAIRRNKVAVYEVIEEVVPNLLKTGWQDNPFFRDYVEFKSMNDGDTNEFYVEDEVILTVSELSGNHHDLVRQRLGEGSTFGVRTSWYGIKIYAEYEKFMAGKVDWATFVQKIYEAFDKKVNAMLYEAVMAAGDKVLPDGRFSKTMQIAAENKEAIIELVQDLESLTGDEVVLMGTRVALSKLDVLTPTEWISDSMKEERHTTGMIGVWEGIRKVVLPQAFEQGSVTNKLVDNNRILLMPTGDNKFIKMYDEGDAQVKEVTDGNTNMDKTIEYEYQQKMGVATVINKKFGQIKITAE